MKNYFCIIFFVLMSISTFAQEQISPKWFGSYSLNFSRKRNYAPEMYWEHNFVISKKTCHYEGTGFQFEIKYECTVKENKDTLFVYAKTYQDGYKKYEDNELIMKMYKIKRTYYTKSITLKPEEAQNKMTKWGYIINKSE